MRRTLDICKRPILLVPAMLGLLVLPAVAQMATFDQTATKPDGAVTLALTPRGFQTTSIAMRAGNIALVVLNRSQIRNLTVNISQEGSSGVVLSSQHSPTVPDVWHFVTVQPGTYHLVVDEQPAWTCTLTVVAK